MVRNICLYMVLNIHAILYMRNTYISVFIQKSCMTFICIFQKMKIYMCLYDIPIYVSNITHSIILLKLMLEISLAISLLPFMSVTRNISVHIFTVTIAKKIGWLTSVLYVFSIWYHSCIRIFTIKITYGAHRFQTLAKGQ